MIRIFLVLVLLGVLGAGVVGGWGYATFTRPGPLSENRTLVIKSGSELKAIAAALAAGGVIGDPLVFRAGVRVIGVATKLRAGEFEFPARVSPLEAARILETGDTVLRRVTVAEGLTSREVVSQLLAVEGLDGFVEVRVPEGSLLPETYYFSFGDTRAALIGRMRSSMEETVAELWRGRAPDLPLPTPAEAVILASIVEKETGLAAERALVAGVFVNRLRRGMRLQSDPTVAYGITKGAAPLGRSLTRADLKARTDYNTYMIDGLPPGPIANPGRASIQAVLNPADTDALFFVADGSGGHVFARTLDEHNRNVRKWRRIRDAQQSGGAD